MRILGVFLCIIGVALATWGAFAYLSDREAGGIAGIVLGGGLFLIGAMTFGADVLLRLARRSAYLEFNCDFVKLHLRLHGELGKPDDEEESSRQGHSVSNTAVDS